MVTRNGTGGRRTAHNAQTSPRRRPVGEPPAWQSVYEAWTAVGRRVPRMRDDLATLANVQVDRVRLRFSHLVGKVLGGSVVVLTLSALTTVAATLLLLGVTGGLATLLDDRLWLAATITGSAALVGLLLISLFAIHSRAHQRLAALQERYRDSQPTDDPAPGATPPSPTADQHAL